MNVVPPPAADVIVSASAATAAAIRRRQRTVAQSAGRKPLAVRAPPAEIDERAEGRLVAAQAWNCANCGRPLGSGERQAVRSARASALPFATEPGEQRAADAEASAATAEKRATAAAGRTAAAKRETTAGEQRANSSDPAAHGHDAADTER